MMVLLIVTVCAAGMAAQPLYNGIELPDRWPPKLSELSFDPQSVPYLKSRPAVIPIDLGRQLFVDDFLIQQTSLRRVFHAAEIHPNSPVLVPDRAWERKGEWRGYVGPHAIPFSDGVWYDPKDRLFKMWYMAGVLDSTCLAISKDGIHWEKPDWGVVAGTNVVHTGNRDSCTVWLDLDDSDPGRRYKMFRFQKSPRRGLVLSVSSDGVHWSNDVRWAGACNDRSTVFYNPFRKVWVYSLKSVGRVAGVSDEERIRRYWELADLLKSPMWSKMEEPYLWATCDRLDPQWPLKDIGSSKIYNLDAVAYESVMLGAFSILQTYYGKENKERPKRNEVLLGFSRDGFNWDRPCRKPFIGVSERRGDWNWGNIQSAGGICLVVGDKLHFYFSARAGSARLGREKCHSEADAGTGLAILRRDGFASMEAGPEEGALTTCPLRFSGRYLFANMAVTEGELRAEVLDGKGQVIESFSKERCIPVRTDRTIARLNWQGITDLSCVAGKEVCLRFHLRNGRLYSFWVSPDESGASHGYVAAGGPGFITHIDTVGTKAMTASGPTGQ